jgi:phosphatidylglycerol:prolipoprotein diacylglycerol transferase
MHPVLIQFGPLAIRWYGVMYGIGILIGGWLLGKEFRRKGVALSDDERWNFLTLVFLSGILGARTYYVAFNWDFYSSHPGEILAIWHGGLAIHGGLIGGVLGGAWYVRRHRLSFLKLADAGAPSLILAHALGRIGNFMNGEINGY